MARKTQEKLMAKELYINTDKTQLEIAETCKVTDKTIRKWIKEGDWQAVREAKKVSNQQIIKNLYSQILKLSLNDELSASNAKEIAMLAGAIEKISNKPQIHHFTEAFIQFNSFLISKGALDLAKQLNSFQVPFLHSLKN